MDFRFRELRDKLGMLARVLDARVTEDLQAFAARVIIMEEPCTWLLPTVFFGGNA